MRLVLFFSVLAVAAGSTASAASTPEEIVLAFFGAAGIADKKSHYSGEMLSHLDRPTLGESLPQDVRVVPRVLSRSGDRYVVAVDLVKDGETRNWYAFLRNQDGWKMEAVRTLATMGVPAQLFEELRRKAHRTAEEEWTFQNLALLLKPDDQLKEFVRANAGKLEQIAALVREGRDEGATAAAKEMFINSAKSTGSGRIELTIGGILDNSVGIMFVPDGEAPPPLDPSEYIYVEPVLGRWFLFKTT